MRNVCKPDLYQLIKITRPIDLFYKIDSLLTEHNTILRIPPDHPQLIVNELILETVKDLVTE
jgi:hypothetical protein